MKQGILTALPTHKSSGNYDLVEFVVGTWYWTQLTEFIQISVCLEIFTKIVIKPSSVSRPHYVDNKGREVKISFHARPFLTVN